MARFIVLLAVGLVGELVFGPSAWAQCPGGVCPTPQFSAPQGQYFAPQFYGQQPFEAGRACFCVELNMGQLPYAPPQQAYYAPPQQPYYAPGAAVQTFREFYQPQPHYFRQTTRQRYR